MKHSISKNDNMKSEITMSLHDYFLYGIICIENVT